VSLRSETIEESACSRNALLLMNQRAQAAKLSNLAKERKSFAAHASRVLCCLHLFLCGLMS